MTTYLLTNLDNKKILQKECNLYGGFEYNMINCDENFLSCNEKPEIKQCRSIVLSKPEGKMCSFSLPLKTPLDQLPKTQYPWEYVINEFIEGPLIHLFFDHRSKKWEMASRRGIGGYYPISQFKLHKKQEYYVRTLFCDALSCNSIDKIANIDDYSKDHCYNFILQHPKINQEFELCKVYLINVFKIEENSAKYIDHEEVEHWKCFSSTNILFPKKVIMPVFMKEYSEVYLEKVCQKNQVNGMVIYYKPSGQFSVFKRSLLLMKQKNKYVNPYLLFRFLCIQQLDQMKDSQNVFNVFPKKTYKNCKELYNEIVYQLYQDYLHIFVYKKMEKKDSHYSFYLDELYSQCYLRSLGKKRPSFHIQTVKDYVKNLSLTQQYYLLCSPFRN
tara:strand:- start:1615 stop:2772 length:1158 start_codon:yes stop_codon:yes gene_type:complete